MGNAKFSIGYCSSATMTIFPEYVGEMVNHMMIIFLNILK